MEPVNLNEAKTHLSRLVERVQNGHEVIIAKSGRPVARLVPIEPLPPREPGGLKGPIEDSFFDPLPEEELRAWEGG